jgi:hypothetical protein
MENNTTIIKKNHYELIYDILLEHCVNSSSIGLIYQSNQSNQSNQLNQSNQFYPKLETIGILDSNKNFYTNKTFGNIPFEYIFNKSGVNNLKVIEPNTYSSVGIIEIDSNTFGFIFSKCPISDEDDLIKYYSPENFDIYNLPISKQKFQNILNKSSVRIYGLKNKLLFGANFISRLNIDNLINDQYIKSRLDIWFRHNNFETKCIYINSSNILNTLYTDDNFLTFFAENTTKSDTTKSDTTKSDIDPIIDIFFKLSEQNKCDLKITDQINQIFKKYKSKYNLIVGYSDDDFAIINKYIESDTIGVEKYNMLFTYNYPIYLYSNI